MRLKCLHRNIFARCGTKIAIVFHSCNEERWGSVWIYYGSSVIFKGPVCPCSCALAHQAQWNVTLIAIKTARVILSALSTCACRYIEAARNYEWNTTQWQHNNISSQVALVSCRKGRKRARPEFSPKELYGARAPPRINCCLTWHPNNDDACCAAHFYCILHLCNVFNYFNWGPLFTWAPASQKAKVAWRPCAALEKYKAEERDVACLLIILLEESQVGFLHAHPVRECIAHEMILKRVYNFVVSMAAFRTSNLI